MRPTAAESLRGMQASLFEVIGPEVKSPFAQHTLQTMFMLLQSVAAELDGAESAASDAQRIDELLENVARAVGSQAVPELATIAGDLPAADDDARWGLLERAIVGLEASAGRQSEELEACRQEIYAFLREVAGRGWSFWDMLSFRQNSS
jgi:chaperonin cofactor prefoldin